MFGDLVKPLTDQEMRVMDLEVTEAQGLLMEHATAMDYLRQRGIEESSIDRFRLGVDQKDRIVIPYLTIEGVPRYIKRRSTDGSKPKYIGTSGYSPIMFNVRDIIKSDILHVTEGEFDCMILAQCGFNAVGIPGADAVDSVTGTMLEGVNGLVVWPDGDPTGSNMVDKLKALTMRIPVVEVQEIGDGEDVNSKYLSEGEFSISIIADAYEGKIRTTW